jgi:hypothetical protein
MEYIEKLMLFSTFSSFYIQSLYVQCFSALSLPTFSLSMFRFIRSVVRRIAFRHSVGETREPARQMSQHVALWASKGLFGRESEGVSHTESAAEPSAGAPRGDRSTKA